jgi:hypothetical protein
MSTQREVLQQALEALERADKISGYSNNRKTITAIRAALAEQKCPCGDRPAEQCLGEWEPGCDMGSNPKYAKVAEPAPQQEVQEPVAWAYQWKQGQPLSWYVTVARWHESDMWHEYPLYTVPQQRPAEPQEPHTG